MTSYFGGFVVVLVVLVVVVCVEIVGVGVGVVVGMTDDGSFLASTQ